MTVLQNFILQEIQAISTFNFNRHVRLPAPALASSLPLHINPEQDVDVAEGAEERSKRHPGGMMTHHPPVEQNISESTTKKEGEKDNRGGPGAGDPTASRFDNAARCPRIPPSSQLPPLSPVIRFPPRYSTTAPPSKPLHGATSSRRGTFSQTQDVDIVWETQKTGGNNSRGDDELSSPCRTSANRHVGGERNSRGDPRAGDLPGQPRKGYERAGDAAAYPRAAARLYLLSPVNGTGRRAPLEVD
ncbi:hypothetical protein BDN70DRAFT_901604 [Pholiota conissans]|uniref:Uncharacterized protein n=1 Tax=Pholiota conissans TaxID=109636 RepID=A0A9P5YNM5_9AGAR|nr:hypothetical protein BDN70DRAFT_901604 [Pholiota conissans]